MNQQNNITATSEFFNRIGPKPFFSFSLTLLWLRADYYEAPGQEILAAADCREMTLMRSQNAILAAILVTRDAARASLIKVLDNYTAVYRKGCTPPDATGWNNTGNNEASSRERSRPRLRAARAG